MRTNPVRGWRPIWFRVSRSLRFHDRVYTPYLLLWWKAYGNGRREAFGSYSTHYVLLLLLYTYVIRITIFTCAYTSSWPTHVNRTGRVFLCDSSVYYEQRSLLWYYNIVFIHTSRCDITLFYSFVCDLRRVHLGRNRFDGGDLYTRLDIGESKSFSRVTVITLVVDRTWRHDRIDSNGVTRYCCVTNKSF